jgi:hypothetical protein
MSVNDTPTSRRCSPSTPRGCARTAVRVSRREPETYTADRVPPAYLSRLE